jgi:transcriptional regulator with XRE-family HTH domain
MSTNQYKKFGTRLKTIRESARESLAELSGAVEVDTTVLTNIENGVQQPSEDLVLLIISHFALKEDEALKLWELAGYEQENTGLASIGNESGHTAQSAFIHAEDARIIYTDMVHVSANKYGVVINFLQGLGAQNQPMAVSRIGMSHEHAKSMLDVLQETIAIAKKNIEDIEKQAKGETA